ncbi:hypothetical protein U1Q18_038130 [Sarracenia purpurea var. burkii]
MGKNEAHSLAAGGGGAGIGVFIGRSATTSNRATTKGDRVRKPHDHDDEESDRTNLAPDLLATMSLRLHKKKRMPRRRRSSLNASAPPMTIPTFSSHVSSPSTPPLPSARAIDRTRLRFLFQKELRTSDVGSLRRMIIPKKAAESYLPTLMEKKGFFISMDDMDSMHVWSFKFSWLRKAQAVIYQVIRARKASGQNICIDSTRNTINDYFSDDFEVNDSGQGPVNFPTMDDNGMPFVHEATFSSDSETSYVYDTTSSNDSLFDFWSGPMTYISRVEPVESFESLKNSSLEELLLSF